MTARLLVSGDIHIGRRPTKVDGADALRWSCARIWDAIVERAINESVDALLLSGDIVDHANRFFEATGPLEKGIRQLAENNIPTIAVSGNHDFEVLHRLADSIDSSDFRLLGRGGKWQETTLERNGNPLAIVQGWSFPAAHVPISPLSTYNLTVDNEIATIGLLHADLAAADSRYAPVRLDELRRSAIHFWVLGHIHSPKLYQATGQSSVLYPGSPQAMHPGETGVHGPWLLEIGGPRSIDARMLALSKVQYDALNIDVTGVNTVDEIEPLIVRRVRETLDEAVITNGSMAQLQLRLSLVGTTHLFAELEPVAERAVDELSLINASATALVESVENNTTPDIDLAACSNRSDPIGQLARLILALQSQTPQDEVDEVDELVRAAHRSIVVCYEASAFSPINGDAKPSIDTARDILSKQAYRILEELRSQQAPA